MNPPVAAALFLLSASAPDSIVAGDRLPAVMLVALPKEAASTTPTSEFLAAAAAAFQRRTGFDLLSVEQAGFDGERLARCDPEARLACWANEVRSMRLLFVLTVLPFEKGRDRLSATLIETAPALRCRDAADRSFGDWPAKVEDCIYERSVRSPPEVIETADRARLAAYFDALLLGDFKPRLEAMHMFEPFGRIALRADQAGAEIALDGAAVGKTSAGLTRIVDVAPGRRTLSVRPRGGGPIEVAADVARGETASVAVNLDRAFLQPERSVGRTALWIGGSAAAVLGVVLAAVSIEKSHSVVSRCFVAASNPGAGCASLGDPTFSFHGDALPTADRDAVNPGGVALLPLSAGLFAGGGAWSVAALLGDSSQDPTWIELAAGAAIGLLAFGTAELLDRR